MRKRLLLFFFIGFFLFMPNVFADSFYVCNDGCDYSTLDDALTAAEHTNYDAYIYLYENGSYTISSHTFNADIYIYAYNENVGTVTINGNGSTIRSNNVVWFYDDYENHDFVLKNVNFVSDFFYDEEFLYIEYFNNTEISNVSVIVDEYDYDWTAGIYLYENYGTNIIDSVTIEGFCDAIYLSYYNHATIQNSKLDKNLYSIDTNYSNVKVINTELSFIYLYESFIKVDVLDNKTVKLEQWPSFNSEEENTQFKNQIELLHHNRVYEDYLYILYDDIMISQFKKDMTIKENSINLLDIWFYDNDYSISDFDIDNLNDEVVSIENGVVKPLKGGKSVVILTDKYTGHEYRLTVNVDIPKEESKPESVPVIVNPKTKNSLIVVGILLLFMIGSLGTMIFKKQH